MIRVLIRIGFNCFSLSWILKQVADRGDWIWSSNSRGVESLCRWSLRMPEQIKRCVRGGFREDQIATRIADRCVRAAADRCRGNAGRWSPWPRKLPRRMDRDQELLPGGLLEQHGWSAPIKSCCRVTCSSSLARDRVPIKQRPDQIYPIKYYRTSFTRSNMNRSNLWDQTNKDLTRVHAIVRSKAYVLEMFLIKTEKTYLNCCFNPREELMIRLLERSSRNRPRRDY